MAQWVFTLTGPEYEDEKKFRFGHIDGRTVRFFKDIHHAWELIEGEWLEPGDNSLLGQIAFKGSVVALEAVVRGGATIKPRLPYSSKALRADRHGFVLPMSSRESRKAAFLRPGDEIHFEQESLLIQIDLITASGTSIAEWTNVDNSTHDTNVEIKSSNPPHGEDFEPKIHDQNGDDEDAMPPAASEHSTPDRPAYSTAPQVIQETPTKLGHVKDEGDHHETEVHSKNQAAHKEVYEAVNGIMHDASETETEGDAVVPDVSVQETDGPGLLIHQHALFPEGIAVPVEEAQPGVQVFEPPAPFIDDEMAAADRQPADNKLPQPRRAASGGPEAGPSVIPSSADSDLLNRLSRTPTPIDRQSLPTFHPINGSPSSDSANAPSKKRKNAAAAEGDVDEQAETPPSGKRLRSLQSCSAKSHSTPSQKSSERNSSPAISAAPAPDDAYTGPLPLILSSNSDVCNQEPYKKFLRKQGAKTTEKLETANFLCLGTTDLKTTAKLLISLAMGKTIVTDEWVTDSQVKGYLLNPDVYLHKDLQDVESADRSQLFARRAIYITPALKKQYGAGFTDIHVIMRHAGAKETSVKPAKDIADDDPAISIGLESNDKDAISLINRGLKCYRKELMSASILEGHLLTDNEDFLIRAPAETTPMAGRKMKAAK